MVSSALSLFYAYSIVCCTVTFGAVYINTSKSVIEEGESFEINCTVKPLTSAVQFLLDGVPKGDCSAPVPGLFPGTCTTDIVQDINTEETTLTITSASISSHQGTWKCEHISESAEIQIEVLNFITVLTNNQYELPATIETSSSPNSEFKVFVACGYPQPTISWTLDTCDGSQTGITVNSPTLITNTSAGCTSPLVAYTSAIKASALASPTVETCYIPKATMTYTEKPSVMPSSQFTSQVQFPGKSPDSPKSDTTAIVVGVLIGTVALVILIVGPMIYFKVYKRKGTQSKSKEDNKLVPSVQKTPVVTGPQLVPSEQKTPVVTGTQLVPSEQKTPVVTGMPLEPEGPLKIKTRQDHVEFQWNAPKSDGGSEITEYIVEVNGIKFDTWETFEKSSSMKLKVPMEKFKDGKVMSFRVRAQNEYGLSKPLSAQKPFTLQTSHDLLANRPVVTNQGRGHDGGSSLLEQVPIDRTLPKPV